MMNTYEALTTRRDTILSTSVHTDITIHFFFLFQRRKLRHSETEMKLLVSRIQMYTI